MSQPPVAVVPHIIETKPSTPALGTHRPLISICTPVYNEEDNVERCVAAVRELFAGALSDCDYEHIFTDNHSTDATFSRLAAIAATDPRVRVLRFSRNFGYQRSILANYKHAAGDAAIQLDCDLEDPPAIAAEFVRLWRRGYKVVYGVRRSRIEPRVVQLARKSFYRLLAMISEDSLPQDAGDFRLIDRRVIDVLAKIHDPNIYIRGRVSAMGFSQIGVDYHRDARIAGTTKFNVWRLMSLAIDATLSHSVVPLRVATGVGLLMFILAGAMMVFYAVARLAWGSDWPSGFTTLAVLLLLAIGLNGLFLGIIGEYLARIYRHLKDTSDVVIEQTIPAIEDEALKNPQAAAERASPQGAARQ